MGESKSVKVGSELTAVGLMWYVIDGWGDKHWFSTRALAIRWAARHRYNLMLGEGE